jgi:hypothetical protein
LPGRRGRGSLGRVPVTIEEVRAVAMALPRTHEGMVRGKVKFYVGRIVYIAFEREGIMGFGFPREWREAAVAGEPDKFLMPTGGDLRYNWLLVRMDAIDAPEMRELVTDAWSIVVPQKVIEAYLASGAERSTD